MVCNVITCFILFDVVIQWNKLSKTLLCLYCFTSCTFVVNFMTSQTHYLYQSYCRTDMEKKGWAGYYRGTANRPASQIPQCTCPISYNAPLFKVPQIAKFMGPTWGPPGSCRPEMGPVLAPWALLSGAVLWAMGQVHCGICELFIPDFLANTGYGFLADCLPQVWPLFCQSVQHDSPFPRLAPQSEIYLQDLWKHFQLLECHEKAHG